MIDKINPTYYGGKENLYEAIKIIQAHNLNFSLGNAIKYILRAGKKNQDTKIEDLKKAIWYLESEIKNNDQ
jgi:translation initiation factor 2B subunit (eIF-2B alpha/beta/delta family)